MKRTITLLITLSLMLMLFAGCNEKEAVTDFGTITADELKEINVAAGGLELPLDDKGTEIVIFTATDNTGLNDSVVVKELRRRTGINIQIMEIPKASMNEKMQVLIASKDSMPDIGGNPNINQTNDLGIQGAYANIFEYVDKLPNFKKIFIDEAKERGTEKITKSWVASNGGLYQFPSYDKSRDVNHGMLYRKDIFDKHGIKMWNSPEEFYNVLKQLKTIYPDSTPFVSKTGTQFFTQNAASWGVQNWPGISYNFDNGSWTYAGLQPEFKKFLEFVKKLYDEGLIDQEFITCTQSAWTQKMTQADKAFVTFDWIGRLDQFTNQSTVSGYDLRYANPMGPEQKVITLPKALGGTAIKKSEKSELALKFLDYLLSDGGNELVNIGVEGVTFEWNEDKTKAKYLLDINETLDENTLEAKWGISIPSIALRADRRGWQFQFTEREQEAQDLMLNKENGGFLSEHPELSYTAEEMKIINEHDVQLRKISEEFATKYILTGKNTQADWDKYFKDMKNAGLDKVIKCHNDAQARYNKN